MTFADLANSALDAYEVQRRHGLDEAKARVVAVDWIREITEHNLIIEEPECCDALPRVEWLHHATCPEVLAQHAQHETSHFDCPTCAVQKRVAPNGRGQAEPRTLQH